MRYFLFPIPDKGQSVFTESIVNSGKGVEIVNHSVVNIVICKDIINNYFNK
jgi:hypothetical protein